MLCVRGWCSNGACASASEYDSTNASADACTDPGANPGAHAGTDATADARTDHATDSSANSLLRHFGGSGWKNCPRNSARR